MAKLAKDDAQMLVHAINTYWYDRERVSRYMSRVKNPTIKACLGRLASEN